MIEINKKEEDEVILMARRFVHSQIIHCSKKCRCPMRILIESVEKLEDKLFTDTKQEENKL